MYLTSIWHAQCFVSFPNRNQLNDNANKDKVNGKWHSKCGSMPKKNPKNNNNKITTTKNKINCKKNLSDMSV